MATKTSKEWQAERKFRYTASNFHTIVKRQRNHDTLVNNLLHPKLFTAKQTAHGKTYEPVALNEYEKYMFSTRNPVSAFKSGLVVNMASPFLAASLDGEQAASKGWQAKRKFRYTASNFHTIVKRPRL